jgi:hypothetical protein
MPIVFVGMAAAMGGVHWAIRRRQELMNPSANPAATEPADTDAGRPDTGEGPNEEIEA